jgi:hypothetical protein
MVNALREHLIHVAAKVVVIVNNIENFGGRAHVVARREVEPQYRVRMLDMKGEFWAFQGEIQDYNEVEKWL